MDSLERTLSLPLLGQLSRFRERSNDLAGELGARLNAFSDLAGRALVPAPDTPLNGRLGPHRRVDWLTLPLTDVKRVKNNLGCTVNDVVLATVTGAVRQYLVHRGVAPDKVDFRVSAPVSIRSDAERGTLGNRVSDWILALPHAESLRWIGSGKFMKPPQKERNLDRHWRWI